MLKKTVKRIAESKMFYIVISIAISLLLWMYVVNVENMEQTNKVTGIPVEFVGKNDIMVDRGLLISGDDEHTVDISFYGKRSIVSKLDKENVKVRVDLTDNRNVGIYQEIYEVILPEGDLDKDVVITERYPQYIIVSIDRRMEKNVPVRVELMGSVAEGYMADEYESNPGTVNISGPEAEVSRIEYAEVVIKRENLKETLIEESRYVFVDSEGNPVESDKIIRDVETVEAKLSILLVKDVALTVDIIPGGGAVKENAKVSIQPGTIKISGDPDLLKGINQLSLGTINLAELSSSYKQTMTIPIPNGVNNLSGEISAEVTVDIVGLATKKLSGTNIEIINAPSGYIAAVASQKPLEIIIRGPAEEVAQVASHNIRIVCDLSEIEQVIGMKSFSPAIYVDGFESVGVISNYDKVVISLTRAG